MEDKVTNKEWVQSMELDELADFLAHLLSNIFDLNEMKEWAKRWLELPKGEKLPPI